MSETDLSSNIINTAATANRGSHEAFLQRTTEKYPNAFRIINLPDNQGRIAIGRDVRGTLDPANKRPDNSMVTVLVITPEGQGLLSYSGDVLGDASIINTDMASQIAHHIDLNMKDLNDRTMMGPIEMVTSETDVNFNVMAVSDGYVRLYKDTLSARLADEESLGKEAPASKDALADIDL